MLAHFKELVGVEKMKHEIKVDSLILFLFLGHFEQSHEMTGPLKGAIVALGRQKRSLGVLGGGVDAQEFAICNEMKYT
jgi:hypothetical protein